jgi:heptosyltransferase II
VEVSHIKNVIVRAPTWLGDAVMCIPALRELRSLLPDARVTLASRPGTADLFIDADFVDEVRIYDRKGWASAWTEGRAWRQRRYDLALLFQNAFEAAVIAFLGRVPIRLGYKSEGRGFLLTHPIAIPDWKDQRHESFYYLHLVTELEKILFTSSKTGVGEPLFNLSVTNERRAGARQLLRRHGFEEDKPIVLLCPGSINSRAKRWPAERYATLADRLIEKGINVAIIGSPGELPVAEEVCKRAQSQPALLTGQTTVAEVAALISVANLLITNDTGPAHVGAALNTPTIVIFGPTNPLTTFPFSDQAEIVRRPPDCAPCMLRDCPIDHRCMTAIEPEDILERAMTLI